MVIRIFVENESFFQMVVCFLNGIVYFENGSLFFENGSFSFENGSLFLKMEVFFEHKSVCQKLEFFLKWLFFF